MQSREKEIAREPKQNKHQKKKERRKKEGTGKERAPGGGGEEPKRGPSYRGPGRNACCRGRLVGVAAERRGRDQYSTAQDDPKPLHMSSEAVQYSGPDSTGPLADGDGGGGRDRDRGGDRVCAHRPAGQSLSLCPRKSWGKAEWTRRTR